MTSVTQTIPTLTGGLSQQPDELKIPGQVNTATNVIPDVTHGLLKRPGGKLIASLSDDSNAGNNSSELGRWFHYYRDEQEQFIGQVHRNGFISMWTCNEIKNTSGVVEYAAGAPVKVHNTIGNELYLTHNNDEDIQTLTLNDFTFLTNRSKTVAMLTGTSDKEPVRPPEVFIDLRATSYARQYAVNLYDDLTTTEVRTATRISVKLVKSSNNYCHTDGSIRTHNLRTIDTTRCSSAAGDNRDAYAPNVGTDIFDVDDGATLYDTGPYNPTTPYAYVIDVKDSNDTSVNRGKNLYFRIRTTGQSVPFTTGSGENQTTTYQARYTTTHDLLYGGEGWKQGDYFYVWMTNAYYKVTIEAISTTKVQSNLGLVRPNPTPFDTETTVTAASILGDIRNGILGTNYGGVNPLNVGTNKEFRDDSANGYEVKQIGNGLYITRPASVGPFNITAASSDLLKVMSSEVKNVDDLPDQCRHGYVVKVANSAADEDDYYVKFFGNNDKDGDGVWEECAKPGDEIAFDKSTMPIQLVRRFDDGSGTITGTAGKLYFSIEEITYDNAEVGTTVDGGTNPRPSFVGKTINKLVFFRNRLVMLSDENVIMSRPGDFFNFWSRTATTFTPQDVIDLSCSSEYPAIVYDGIQINAGLLLFTKNQQFMLTTDSDILSPETAKINAVSAYNFNEKTSPVSLGTTVAFLDNANKFTRFFEMSNVLRQGEPDVVDQSKVISRLLDKDINIIAESRENSVIFFAKKGTKTIYGFRYFASGERRLLQAWFTWEVVGDVQYLCMLDDALYVITRGTGNKDQMVKYSLKLDDTGFFVTDTQETTDTDDDVIYRVHLDNMSVVSGGTYNPTTKETTFAKPNGYLYDNTQLVAYDIDQGFSLGRYQKVSIEKDSNNNPTGNYKVAGNWSGQLNTITVTAAGSGYTSAPTVAFSGGGGTEAAGTATVVDGKVTHIEISNTGMNFTSAPTIVIGPVWQAHNASDPLLYSTYEVGDQVTNDNGKLYTCIQAGTAATSGGPTGTGTDITDGTVKWTYAGTQATATATVNGSFVIGYLYEMDVQIPTFYVTRPEGTKYRADAKSSLIIHRVKFSFGPLGVYTTTITRVGKPDYTETTELGLAGFVEANRLPIVEEKIETVPCYERNTNLKVNVKSSHPSPASLYSLAWEGDFTNRFYRRV